MADLSFEAFCEVCGLDWQAGLTDTERGRINSALKEIRKLHPDVTDQQVAGMIRVRANAWKMVYPQMHLTPQALVGQWSVIVDAHKETSVRRVQQTNRPASGRDCPECQGDKMVLIDHPDGYEVAVPCPKCGGARSASGDLTGKFHGQDATSTERASGEAIEVEDRGPLKPGSAGHSVLSVYGDGERHTAYDASLTATGDFHARRREATRLLERGCLVKDGEMPNRAPNGREHVDAYRITNTGREELLRLDNEGGTA